MHLRSLFGYGFPIPRDVYCFIGMMVRVGERMEVFIRTTLVSQYKERTVAQSICRRTRLGMYPYKGLLFSRVRKTGNYILTREIDLKISYYFLGV